MKLNSLNQRINQLKDHLTKVESTYERLCAAFIGETQKIIPLNESEYFDELLPLLGPCLTQEKAKVDLKTIYDMAFHRLSLSLIIANRGATLFCRSPSSLPYITRHLGCVVFRPELGIETANIGLVGNIYEGNVVLRSESACAPAFLFNTQRCNCCYQWASIKELAAHLNPVNPPAALSPDDFEKWVESHYFYSNGKHIPKKSGPGFILMHLDSQSGMGSGFTPNEFVYDLYSRALLRQLGENTTEQTSHTTMKEGYEAIGVIPDSRKENHYAGYKLTPILLDWLQASQTLICLSNNQHKLKQLEEHGYAVKRLKSLGKIELAGAREAAQRGNDFNHMDINGTFVSFDEELARLKEEILCH